MAVIEGAEKPENAEEKVAKVLAAAGAKVIFQMLDSGHLIPEGTRRVGQGHRRLC